MLRHHPIPALTLTIAAISLALSACNPRQPESRSTAAATGDSAASAESETSSGSARKVGEVSENLKNPESAHYDRDLDTWFVSNVNGDPAKKDNNGYISRIKADGTPDTAKFVVAGKNGVTLNAPKGLTVTG